MTADPLSADDVRGLTLDELAKRLAETPQQAREEIVTAASAFTASMKWIPQPGPQTDAFLSPAKLVLFGGQAGGGKALHYQALVLTPFGWRQIGDLKVGSAICATDGTVQHVIGVYPQGKRDVYRLRWSDGSKTVCDTDHVWLGWAARHSRKVANRPVSGEASARKWTTAAIAALYAAKSKYGRAKLTIPVMSAPAAFNVHGEQKGPHKHVSRITPPYVLGVLLGDGSLTAGDTLFCSADPEIPDRVETALQSLGDVRLARHGTASGRSCRYFRIADHVLKANLSDLGLMGKGSAEKFIPRIYLFATINERWELLRGLMDTDGWAEADGDCYFTSVSKRLAEDVRHLARSLGAIVTWREKIPTFTHRGEKKKGQRAYTLRIKMRAPERMFALSRKAATCAGKEPQSMGLLLEGIEPAGREETICIAVSHPNSLYITDDFIVTHNSDLGLGMALTSHMRSLVVRQKYVDLSFLTDRTLAINGTRQGYNGSNPPSLKTDDGRFIQFAGAKDAEGWQGVPFDLKFFDEAVQIPEAVIRFHIGWLRSTEVGQRTRMLLASNPPISAEGDWIVRMFAPWLDVTHPNPAVSGELRWFVRDPDGNDVEVPGPEPVDFPGQLRPALPMSRTFIPSKLTDNAYLVNTDYASSLDAMEEPYRSAFRDGNFMAGRADVEHQVIRTSWLHAAVKRWRETERPDFEMSAIGVDVGAGGIDRVVLAPRHGEWYAPLIVVPGKAAPDGSSQAALIVRHRRDNCGVVVDVSGGYGGDCVSRLADNSISAYRFNASELSSERAKDGTKRMFLNRRAEAWGRFAEALNPDQPGGSIVCLPDDPELIAELAAPCWLPDIAKAQVEPKSDVKARLGRSPDKGDAVVMAWAPGDRAKRRVRSHIARGGERSDRGVIGYADLKSKGYGR